VREKDRIEIGSFQTLGENWDDANKCWGSSDRLNRGLGCLEKDSRDNLLLGWGVSTYFKGVDKWFP
jgi:hypothetical protein